MLHRTLLKTDYLKTCWCTRLRYLCCCCGTCSGISCLQVDLVNENWTHEALTAHVRWDAKLVRFSGLFHCTILTPLCSTYILGVVSDKDQYLYKHHISAICETSYYHIRQIRQVRAAPDINAAIILKLDYYNSLYYGLPAVSLDRLQKRQISSLV